MSSTIRIQARVDRLVDSLPKLGTLPEFLVTIASTSDLMYAASQSVGTSAESLVYGDVTDDALAVIFNEGPTNFVEYGDSSFTARFKIPAGEFALIPRVSSLAAVQLRADTAAVTVTVLLFKIGT